MELLMVLAKEWGNLFIRKLQFINMKSLNILHCTHNIGRASTGIGNIAMSLASTHYKLGHDVKIWCLDEISNIKWAADAFDFQIKNIQSFPILGPKNLWFSLKLNQIAKGERKRSFNIVHQHGIWTGLSYATEILHQNGVYSIVAPHGALQKWALRKSQWKKRIALAFYEEKNLRSASCLHATGENEIRDFRDFGLSNPIAFIPNGISSEWLSSQGNAEVFRHQFNIPDGKKVLLFLSRITPKKGLPMLFDAIKNVQNFFSEWQLVIAGVEEFGHLDEIKKIVDHRSLQNSVSFVGPLFGQNKRDAFSASDLFILPSYSEGAPIVILEALAAGVPVIATHASPWQSLETYGCGWWPDISATSISEALRSAVNQSPEQLKIMGQRGKELVSAEYTWNKSAQKLIELYEWLLGRRERPSFVLID